MFENMSDNLSVSLLSRMCRKLCAHQKKKNVIFDPCVERTVHVDEKNCSRYVFSWKPVNPYSSRDKGSGVDKRTRSVSTGVKLWRGRTAQNGGGYVHANVILSSNHFDLVTLSQQCFAVVMDVGGVVLIFASVNTTGIIFFIFFFNESITLRCWENKILLINNNNCRYYGRNDRLKVIPIRIIRNGLECKKNK